MPIHTTYTQARADLASLWDEVTRNRKVVIIERRGAKPVALISADELQGLMETAYLLRSSKNAERLLKALARAQQKEGTPQTTDELKREVGLDKAAEEGKVSSQYFGGKDRLRKSPCHFASQDSRGQRSYELERCLAQTSEVSKPPTY